MDIKELFTEKILGYRANYYAKRIYLNTLLNQAIARSAVGASRKIHPLEPFSWEFSGFSQNGEDGIIDYLISNLNAPNKYFIEIGTGNGLENNTSYLAHIKKYAGLQVEGNAAQYEDALITKTWLTDLLCCFVNETSIDAILEKVVYTSPDVLSLDIDGMDYYIMKLLMEKGLRPGIIVVEYNSAFGEERSITIPYSPHFNMFETGHPYLYYGVSIAGWKTLLSPYGYDFLTVETNGVNAFFILKQQFKSGFATGIHSLAFAENKHQLNLFRGNHEEQFKRIDSLPFFEIK